ncbi:hypothetical protein KFL_001910060 [Klebsormidium nitens]|uniref:Uncharacterized protein n=1 Tax=Klebsormidium nitens TaxID=105231 RepID=A0A1Y1I6Y7_KLENI|nr:hypothetical protein KFL_001910060 [Klebsormidium nitens]|eukprot:GAQ84487.1 hypothetical protein KFL_001910060 [Klebsormidium nitens]
MTSLRGSEAQRPARGSQFDPRGVTHVPIGVFDTVDTLKTFVEAEGGFSPGFASYGVSVWAYLPGGGLVAPTMDKVKVDYGLDTTGCLLPWSQWSAGSGVNIRTTVAQVEQVYSSGKTGYVVGLQVNVTNAGNASVSPSIFVALRPIGPAGGPVTQIDVSGNGSALLVNGHVALLASGPNLPSAAGVTAQDDLDTFAATGGVPTGQSAAAPGGTGAGALGFKLTLPAGSSQSIDVLAPVLAGKYAVGHNWTAILDPRGYYWNDTAVLGSPSDGLLQIDVGLADLAGVTVGDIFARARADCAALLSGSSLIAAADVRYGKAYTAMINHAALLFNKGTPDVTVINYNTYNRDGMYVVSMLQRVGQEAVAAAALATFFQHPFSGRVYPEADNPGELLYLAGEQWLLFRNATWLQEAYPSIKALANLIAYVRGGQGTHPVCMNTLAFGAACPASDSQPLRYGTVDGYHPEFSDAFDVGGLRAAALLATAASVPADAQQFVSLFVRSSKLSNAFTFDVAGLRAAALLATAAAVPADAQEFASLSDTLYTKYLNSNYTFSPKFSYFYYCTLWPARLYPLNSGPVSAGFRNVGPQMPDTWLYFPLATAHQGLLAGSRQLGHQTIDSFLAYPKMTGWFTPDEGGASDAGKWAQVGYHNWNPKTASPHGWSLAEFWHLLRESFLFEDGDSLVVFGGVNGTWLTQFTEIKLVVRYQDLSFGPCPALIQGWKTHFGSCNISYSPLSTGQGATLDVSTDTCPPGGYLIRLPSPLQLNSGATRLTANANGDFPVACNDTTNLNVSSSDFFN